MDFNSIELTSYYVNLEILYQAYYFFLESASKAWHTGKARLMGVRRLSRVEFMLWVQGVTLIIIIFLVKVIILTIDLGLNNHGPSF